MNSRILKKADRKSQETVASNLLIKRAVKKILSKKTGYKLGNFEK